MVEQDLDTLEREWRARLDAEDRALWYAVNSLFSTVWENSVQIDGFVQQLRSYRSLWIGYRAIAERLLSDNRPYVSQKLDKIDQYLIDQIRRFEQVRDSRRITEQITRQHLPPYSATPFQQTFNTAFNNWQSLFNRTCVRCGFILGDAYFTAFPCPKCGMNPRPG
jgi:hypothetical protein